MLTPNISSVQFSRSVVSDSLRPHEVHHARPPCPSPTPGVHSDSRPSSQWCHPAISSSVVPFSSCPQSLPASESFPVSQLFPRGGQSTGVSALAPFLPTPNILQTNNKARNSVQVAVIKTKIPGKTESLGNSYTIHCYKYIWTSLYFLITVMLWVLQSGQKVKS